MVGAISGFKVAVVSGMAGAAIIVGGLLVGGSLAGAQEPPANSTPPSQQEQAYPDGSAPDRAPGDRPSRGGGQHNGEDCPKDKMEGSSTSGAGFRGGPSMYF